MTITLTTKESEEYFYNSLCNGLDYMGGYGLSFDYEASDYKKAKESWLKNNPTSTPCREDIYMEILRNGGELTMVDDEGEGENTRSITLKDVHERVPKTPLQHITDMVEENDDACTADVILQTVFFEEIIFG